MATVQPVPTPTHLWVVGILSLLWNGFGAYDYTMSHVGGLAYFETMGLDAEAFAWFEAMPVWATAAWAVGVWGSVRRLDLLMAPRGTRRPAFCWVDRRRGAELATSSRTRQAGSIAGRAALSHASGDHAPDRCPVVLSHDSRR